MTTLEEQLDELLAMSANAGRLGAEYHASEKARDRSLDKRRAGQLARAAKAEWTTAERFLASARRRFLARNARAKDGQ